MDTGEWLTLREAGDLLQVNPATLSQQIKAGKLQAVKRAGVWFTRPEWLEAYRAEHPHPGLQKGQQITRPKKAGPR